MGKGTFLAKPVSDIATLSGGSWSASLPLANLKTQQPTEVARSTNALAASTTIVFDFGVSRSVQAFALVNHNISAAGTVRYQIANVADFSAVVAQTSALAVRPAASANLDRPWDGFDSTAYPGGHTSFYLHPTALTGRYLRVQITDTANPDGYVQIGRFLAGMPFIPTFNFTYGASVRIIDPSTVSESVGGQEWWDKRPIKRAISIGYDALSKDAALGPLYDMQTKLGLMGNLVFCYDPDEPASIKARRTIYGRFEGLEPLVEANASVDAPFTASLSLLEIL